MTNPDNIVRVRARNGGRASVYEANGWCQAYSSGLLKGNGVVQNTSADMNVLVGGSANKPDVVLAENPAGYKVALDLVGQKPVAITAPASNSRISAIVAYTDDLSLATTEDTVTGSPASCGLIVVNGTASSSPVEPTDNQIRTAITADGATGSQAAYVVIATILVANNTTIITDNLITNKKAAVGAANIDFTTFINFGPGLENVTLSGATEIANITVPATGSYVVLGIGAVTGGNGDFATWDLSRNGTAIAQTFTDPSTRPYASLITRVSLTENDIISLKCAYDGGRTLTRPNGILLLRVG